MPPAKLKTNYPFWAVRASGEIFGCNTRSEAVKKAGRAGEVRVVNPRRNPPSMNGQRRTAAELSAERAAKGRAFARAYFSPWHRDHKLTAAEQIEYEIKTLIRIIPLIAAKITALPPAQKKEIETLTAEVAEFQVMLSEKQKLVGPAIAREKSALRKEQERLAVAPFAGNFAIRSGQNFRLFNSQSSPANYADARAVAHGLKTGQPWAIEAAVKQMRSRVGAGDTLVPMPSHDGNPHGATALLAQALARETGAHYAPALAGRARPSQHSRKHGAGALSHEALAMLHTGAKTHGGRVWLVDNVLDTGATMRAGQAILHGAQPLVWYDSGKSLMQNPQIKAPKYQGVSPFVFTAPPFYHYRVSVRGGNYAVLSPLPAKKFTGTDLEQLAHWIAQNSGDSSQKKGTLFVNTWKLPSNINVSQWIRDLPSGPDVKARDKEAAAKQNYQQEHKARLAQNAAEIHRLLPAVEWIKKTFGETALNDANTIALARVLVGESEKFEGITSWRWLEGLKKIGIPPDVLSEGRVYKIIRLVKKAYLAEPIAPTRAATRPRSTPALPQPVRGQLRLFNPRRNPAIAPAEFYRGAYTAEEKAAQKTPAWHTAYDPQSGEVVSLWIASQYRSYNYTEGLAMVERVTDKALLLSFRFRNGRVSAWFPKSWMEADTCVRHGAVIIKSLRINKYIADSDQGDFVRKISEQSGPYASDTNRIIDPFNQAASRAK